MAGLVLAGLLTSGRRFARAGRLPQPFVFDARDTFMDWFNTAWWAWHPGAYEIWRTVYPPLSFLFLRLAGQGGCYAGTPIEARDCDAIGIAAIWICYAVSAALAALSFWRADRPTAPFRSLAFAFGLPLLFAVERGNLILLALPAFVLAYGGLLRARGWRAVAAGVMVNVKPYLLVPIAAWVVTRAWQPVRIAVLAATALYLVSYALFGAGDPGQIVADTVAFATVGPVLLWEQGLYSTSFSPFLHLDTTLAPDPALVTAAAPGWMLVAIPLAMDAARLLTLACVAGAWWRPGRLDETRVALLLFATYLIGQSPGGYAQCFVLFLLFLERVARPGQWISLVAGYLLSIPYDRVLWTVLRRPGDSWLSGLPVGHEVGVSIGMYARPALMLVLVAALAVDSLIVLSRRDDAPRP